MVLYTLYPSNPLYSEQNKEPEDLGSNTQEKSIRNLITFFRILIIIFLMAKFVSSVYDYYTGFDFNKNPDAMKVDMIQKKLNHKSKVNRNFQNMYLQLEKKLAQESSIQGSSIVSGFYLPYLKVLKALYEDYSSSWTQLSAQLNLKSLKNWYMYQARFREADALSSIFKCAPAILFLIFGFPWPKAGSKTYKDSNNLKNLKNKNFNTIISSDLDSGSSFNIPITNSAINNSVLNETEGSFINNAIDCPLNKKSPTGDILNSFENEPREKKPSNLKFKKENLDLKTFLTKFNKLNEGPNEGTEKIEPAEPDPLKKSLSFSNLTEPKSNPFEDLSLNEPNNFTSTAQIDSTNQVDSNKKLACETDPALEDPEDSEALNKELDE